jgi:hypothetical protein
VALGDLVVLEEKTVRVDPVPFAAGSYGVISLGRIGNSVVAVKELNPGHTPSCFVVCWVTSFFTKLNV